MQIRVRLFGVFRNASSIDSLEVDLPEKATIRRLVEELVNRVDRPEFEDLFLDRELNSPLPNAVILVSGREIGSMQGLDSILRVGDEVAILPVAHGGAT